MSNEVGKFLEDIELSELEEIFLNEDINMDILVQLTEKDLQDIGVKKLGQRRKIMNSLKARNDYQEDVQGNYRLSIRHNWKIKYRNFSICK